MNHPHSHRPQWCHFPCFYFLLLGRQSCCPGVHSYSDLAIGLFHSGTFDLFHSCSMICILSNNRYTQVLAPLMDKVSHVRAETQEGTGALGVPCVPGSAPLQSQDPLPLPPHIPPRTRGVGRQGSRTLEPAAGCFWHHTVLPCLSLGARGKRTFAKCSAQSTGVRCEPSEWRLHSAFLL